MQREIRDLKRFKEIADVLLKQGFGYYMHRINLAEKLGLPVKKTLPVPRESFPRKMKLAFEELGGAFVKLGQLLSLRPDLIPEEYCREFSELQDMVPSFPYSQAKEIVESELKKPLTEVFSQFEKRPVAAASVGQVHKAVLRSGEHVVVKVQRPNIREQIESDIDILYFIARLLEKHFRPAFAKPTAILREFESYTERELDYLHEAKNIEVMYNNMRGSLIKIPLVHKSYTTSKVLTLEYIDGKKLSSMNTFSEEDRREIADKIMTSIYRQVFNDGVFHADPHPGNILILKNNNIAFIDFGIVGYVTESLKEKLTDLFIAAVEKDINGLAEALLSLGVVKHDVDLEELKEDIIGNFSEFYNLSFRQIRLSEMFRRILLISKKHNIKLPLNFVLLGKCAITAESVVSTLDPKFNPIEKAKPFVEELVKKKYNPLSIAKDFRKKGAKIASFLMKVPDLSEEAMRTLYQSERAAKMIHKDIGVLTVEMDRSSNRIALAMIAMALIISSSYLTGFGKPFFMGLPFISLVGFALAAFFLGLLVISVVREKHNI